MLLPARAVATGAVREVLDGVMLGQEAGEAELLTLFGARGPEVAAVCEVADRLRLATVGDVVTFVRNRNINYTNVCTYRCRFCGFSKGPLSLNLRGKPYLLTLEDVVERVVEAARRGATEVCLQGGIHPDFDGEYYVHIVQAVKAAAPAMHVHGFTALEVFEGARRLGAPLESYLQRLKAAGLGSLPGTAAEILDDEIRSGHLPRQDHHRRVAGGPPHRPPDRAAVQHHDHVRHHRRPSPLGSPPAADASAATGDRGIHRVRPPALRAHGRPHLPGAPGPPGPDLPRDAAAARSGPYRLPRRCSTTSRVRG